MSLKKTATSFWPEFKTRLSGSRVKAADKALKKMNAMANENGHSIYMKASKKPLGWGITPRHEQFRNQQVQNDDYQQRLYDAMSKAQVKRKAASRDTNRARLALGGVILGGAGLATGATLLAKKMHDKKKQKEQEESYYKTAAMKDIAVKTKDGLVATGKQIAENFAHTSLADHWYNKPLSSRIADIATLKRVKGLGDDLKAVKKYSFLREYGNPSRARANLWIDAYQKDNNDVHEFEELKKKYSKKPEDDLRQSEYLYNQDKHKLRKDEPQYHEKRRQFEIYESNQNKSEKSRDSHKARIDNDVRDPILRNRNNEFAKTVGLYAIPVAATAGGIMLYKRHKKKKRQKEQENKNQIK